MGEFINKGGLVNFGTGFILSETKLENNGEIRYSELSGGKLTLYT